MKVYKVGDEIMHRYHGCGHAVAAVKDDRLVNFIYLKDAVPGWDEDSPGREEDVFVNPAAQPAIHAMRAFGDVQVGMLSCCEFVVT